MTIHLITDHKGEVFGIYEDRKILVQSLGLQKDGLKVDEVLRALGIENHLVVFSEAEMKEGVTLPHNLDDLEITGLLNEAATIASIEANAKRREEKE